jgi:hypothetical protein
MSGIAIPQEGPSLARRTLGSLVPHPAAIGKVAGVPRMKLAGGGIADAENISSNLFQPISPTGIVPNADVNFITSPQLQGGKGPPAAPSSKPQQQPNTLQDITMAGGAANTLTGAYNGAGTLWNGSTMSAADAAAYNTENGLTAGMDDFASAGDTIGGIGDYVDAALTSLGFAKGGATPKRDDGGIVENALQRSEAAQTYHPGGLLNSAGPGRTDTINTNVPSGSYVVPADVTSGIGEGNSLAGSAIIDRMFSSQPHGIQSRPIREGRGVKIPNPPSSEPRQPRLGCRADQRLTLLLLTVRGAMQMAERQIKHQ